MKSVILLAISIFLVFQGCGGNNSEDCKTFCATLQNTSCYGSWTCQIVDKPEAARPCYLDIDVYDNKQLCFQERSQAPAGATINEAKLRVVTNPDQNDNCETVCNANIQGDAMPSSFKDDLKSAGTCTDMLKAQLIQQCLTGSSEK